MEFNVMFHVPSKDFLRSEYLPLKVRTNWEPAGEAIQQEPEFTVSLPEHLFKDLANTEPRFKTVYDVNSRGISGLFAKNTLTHKFKRSQTSTSIKALQDYLYELTHLSLDKHCPEKKSMRKKLFLRFTHSATHKTNGHSNAYHGVLVKQDFQYFTGYEMMTTKFGSVFDRDTPRKQYVTKILYAGRGSSLAYLDTGFQEKEDVLVPLFPPQATVDAVDKEYIILDWTQDREDFCRRIQETFQDVNRKLQSFLAGLTAEQMDAFIASGGFKLLAAPNE
jgi:hypothetical protein